MKIDDTADLLEKESPILGLTYHPIPFPNHRSVLIKRGESVATVLEELKDYQDRTFAITTSNYGVEVSINYEEGQFVSMILRGTGAQGEKVNEDVALSLVPKESKNKNKITLHALLTILDLDKFRGGLSKTEVPKILRRALMEGLMRYEDKSIVCRPYTLFVDGVEESTENIWEIIGNFLMSGLTFYTDYAGIETVIKEDIENEKWVVPRRGIIIGDENPADEKAFPTTKFIIDESALE